MTFHWFYWPFKISKINFRPSTNPSIAELVFGEPQTPVNCNHWKRSKSRQLSKSIGGRVQWPTWPSLEKQNKYKKKSCSLGMPSRVTGDFPDKRRTGEGGGGEGRKNKKGQAQNLILTDRTQSGLPQNYLCLTAFYLSLISVYQPLVFFHSHCEAVLLLSVNSWHRGTASKARGRDQN